MQKWVTKLVFCIQIKEGIRQREDFYKMKNYEDKIYSLVLLCICITLYNETLRCCFAVGEKKKYQKMMINGELVIE